MSAHQTLQQLFPDAMPDGAFVEQSYSALLRFGMTERNTLACACLCRDELADSLAVRINRRWGEAFNFSSLGAAITVGRTGFEAARAHAPIEGGRQRYVFYVMPHIGIGPDGTVGKIRRTGRTDLSTACGALEAFRADLAEGQPDLGFKADDPEQSLLRRRLARHLSAKRVPSLLDLTRLVVATSVADLEALISGSLDPTRSDHAILAGIHVHCSRERHCIVPITTYVVAGGVRSELPIR